MNNGTEEVDTSHLDMGEDDDVELPPASQPVEPAPAAAPAQATPTGKRRGRPPAGVGAPPRAPGRPRGKAGDVPDRFNARAKGPQNWSSHQADVLWPELLQWLEANGRSAYDVMVNVICIEPPPRKSVGEGFEANAAVGDSGTTPADALARIVSDYYHLPVSRTPAKYELQFVWRANGNYITNAYLSLSSPAEIIALRNAQHQRRMQMAYQAPGLGGIGPGMMPPPPSPPMMPQMQQQPQPQQPMAMPMPYVPYGYQQQMPSPPQAPRDSRRDIEIEQLRMEVEQLRRQRQQPQPQPQPQPRPGMGASPPEDMETRIVRRVVEELRGVGLGAPAPQVVTAAPPPINDSISTMRGVLQMMREFRRFSDEAGGMFEPEEPRAALPPSPTEKEDDMPYQITELPSQWADGSHTKLVRDKETGKIDLLGLALLNPFPAGKLMEAGAEFMKRFGARGLAGVPQEQQIQHAPPPQQFSPPNQEEEQEEEEEEEEAASPAEDPRTNQPDPGWGDVG